MTEYGVFAATTSTPRSSSSGGSRSGPAARVRRVGGATTARVNKATAAADDDADNPDLFSGGSVIVSVVENRAREICIAKYDNRFGSAVEVYLLTDSHSYTETMGTLTALAPNEVLLHDGTKQRVLSQKIEKRMLEGGGCRVLYISRQYFDQVPVTTCGGTGARAVCFHAFVDFACACVLGSGRGHVEEGVRERCRR